MWSFFGGWWLAVRALVIYTYAHRPSYRIAEYDGFYANLSVDGERVVSFCGDRQAIHARWSQVYLFVRRIRNQF